MTKAEVIVATKFLDRKEACVVAKGKARFITDGILLISSGNTIARWVVDGLDFPDYSNAELSRADRERRTLVYDMARARGLTVTIRE